MPRGSKADTACHLLEFFAWQGTSPGHFIKGEYEWVEAWGRLADREEKRIMTAEDILRRLPDGEFQVRDAIAALGLQNTAVLKRLNSLCFAGKVTRRIDGDRRWWWRKT